MAPKEECEQILAALLPFAMDQLKKHGGFHPFGAVMLRDGSIELTAYADRNNTVPNSVEAIQSLGECHRAEARRGKIKASGIAWDAVICTSEKKKTDAVLISLEHVDRYSVVVGQPYSFGTLKKLKLGEMFAQEGKHDVFN